MATQATPDHSPEYLSFQENFEALVSTFKAQPAAYADSLFSKGYIPDAVLEYSRLNGVLASDKSRKILDAIISGIKLNPSVFHGFIEAIAGPSTDDVVKKLHDSYERHKTATSRVEQPQLSPSPHQQPLLEAPHSQTVDQNHQKINDDLTVFLDQRLGKGAFGVVFKGIYSGKICAVKVLIHEAIEMQTNMPMGESEEASKAFDRECEFLKTLQHPNIVQYLSTAKHPKSGSTILVVELMDCNLRSYFSGLDEESLTSKCEISLSKDVSCGLAYIHSKQIIHRDLCGDNVLLKLTQPLPVAKISDFGMSRLYDPSKLSHTLTAVGHRMGYLPPEAIRLDKEKYDNSLDVFSLGVIMVQIVCKLETIKSAKDRSFHVAQIPHTHRLRKLIDSCLQEDIKRRPSAGDIYTSLTSNLNPVEATKMKSKDTQPVKSSTVLTDAVLSDVTEGDSSQDVLTSYPHTIHSGASGLRTVTIEEFKKRTKVTNSQLDSKIEEINMIDLAAHLDNVDTYTVQLGLSPAEQRDVKIAQLAEGTQVAMDKALRLWRQHNPGAATYRALVVMLLRMGKEALAVDVCQSAVTAIPNATYISPDKKQDDLSTPPQTSVPAAKKPVVLRKSSYQTIIMLVFVILMPIICAYLCLKIFYY